eukprot:6485158-Amphidinium_carterae.1
MFECTVMNNLNRWCGSVHRVTQSVDRVVASRFKSRFTQTACPTTSDQKPSYLRSKVPSPVRQLTRFMVYPC